MEKKSLSHKPEKRLPIERRSHLRAAKNFLGVLGRATKRVGLKRDNLVQRSISKIVGRIS